MFLLMNAHALLEELRTLIARHVREDETTAIDGVLFGRHRAEAASGGEHRHGHGHHRPGVKAPRRR